MKSSYDVNYRAGLMQPTDEYIPEIVLPNLNGQPQIDYPITDYGPVIEDNHKPTNHFDEPYHLYQKIQYTNHFLKKPNQQNSKTNPHTLRSSQEPHPTTETATALFSERVPPFQGYL